MISTSWSTPVRMEIGNLVGLKSQSPIHPNRPERKVDREGVQQVLKVQKLEPIKDNLR